MSLPAGRQVVSPGVVVFSRVGGEVSGCVFKGAADCVVKFHAEIWVL